MRVRISALLIVLVIGLTSCTRGAPALSKAGPSRTPTPTASPSATPATGHITWTDCGDGFQCGTLAVPLDYKHPAAVTITLALIRKPATDPANRIGSVLTNPGGPGASGIDFLRGEASAMKNLNQRFDLVSFDPRGVGQSSPVHCLLPADWDVFNAIDSVLDDPQEKQAAIDEDKKLVAGCQALSGSLLPFVGTPSAARDMDLIRVALGDDKLTYLGFSYGTYLGQMYAHLFPTHVRALALDGVLDPTITFNDLNLTQTIAFEQDLQAFFADCRARRSAKTPCTYAKSGDPATKLYALMNKLDSQPMVVGDRLLTRELATVGVLVTLYNTAFWPYLDQALTLVDKGNGAGLLALSDAYLGRQVDGSYSNEFDANFAINCVDHPVPTDIASFDQLGPAFAKASQVFGLSSQYATLPCAFWPTPPTTQPGPLTADGAPPILLIGGTGDPATPYAWAQSVHQQLAGSVLLTRNGNGHTSYDASACAHQDIDSYLIDLTLPAEGTVCT